MVLITSPKASSPLQREQAVLLGRSDMLRINACMEPLERKKDLSLQIVLAPGHSLLERHFGLRSLVFPPKQDLDLLLPRECLTLNDIMR